MVLFVLPSFVLLCVMSTIYAEYGEVAAVAGVVRGLGAAVIALVAAAVLRVGGRVIHTPTALALAVVAFGLLIVGVPFPLIIAAAALVGYALGRSMPTLLGRPSGHEEDDSREVPESGLRRRFVKTILIWLVPLALLLRRFGRRTRGVLHAGGASHVGGAYAVLPFVADAAVNRFGWLSADDMVAGLALGESAGSPDHGQHVRRLHGGV